MSYAVNGIAANEFTALRWDKPYTGLGGVNTVGARILQSRGQYTQSYWYWILIVALLGFYIIFKIGFTLGLQFMPAVGKPQAIMSKEELHEKEANRTGADLKMSKSKSSRSQSRSLAAIMSSHGEDAPRLSRSLCKHSYAM